MKLNSCVPSPRRGYSLTVVLIYLMLLFALWSTVYRSSASLLRIESARLLNNNRNEGAVNALAKAVRLLEYSKPSDPSHPARTHFEYGIQVMVPNALGQCEPRDFVVEFDPEPDQGPKRWKVHLFPGTSSVALPNPGDSPQWP